MPKTNQNLNVGYVPNVHDLCSCAACGASNRDPDTDIFDLKADRSHFRLCRSCTEQLMKLADQCLKITDAPGNWRAKLCREILGTDSVTPEQVSRLGLLTATIPDHVSYACLAASYAGGKPEHQAIRPQDKGKALPRLTQLEIDVMAASCLDFLKAPARAEYLETGRSDLDRNFRKEEADLLRSAHILVCADIAARGDDYVLSIPGMTLELAALCSVVKGAKER